MTPVLPTSSVSSASRKARRPYAPSWLETFIAWIHRSPAPDWVIYSGLGLAIFGVVTLVKWSDGSYTPGTFFATHAALAVVVVAIMAVTYWIDEIALSALQDMRPALIVDPDEFEMLRYRLTTIPARPGLLASLLGVALLGLWVFLERRDGIFQDLKLFTSPLANVVDGLLMAFIFAGLGVAVYGSFNIMRLMSHIYATYTNIDLFNPTPIYAFSRVTAFLAASMTFAQYTWLLATPSLMGRLSGQAFAVLVPLLAGAVFVVPLLGVHRQLVEEKAQRQGELAQSINETMLAIQRAANSGKSEGLDKLAATLQTLTLVEQRLDGVPTWPWDPQTPNLLATAILLPVVLWFIQRILERFLGS